MKKIWNFLKIMQFSMKKLKKNGKNLLKNAN